MEAINILSADVLDIIFEHQNKEYGAYQLRKNYNRRMKISLLGTCLVCVLIILSSFLKKDEHMFVKTYIIPDPFIESIPSDNKIVPIVPKIKPQLQTIQFTVPIVVKREVKKEEIPPEVKEIDDAKISTFTQAGEKDDKTEAPPIESKGVTEIPKLNQSETVFTKVEIESGFPGGMQAWTRYLIRNLQYPSEASEIGVQGGITVRFIVDQEGSTSSVEAIDGPKELRDEAVRVIQRSGKWTPAIQNGNKVKSYKLQRIIFKLAE